jgi:putative redox protein
VQSASASDDRAEATAEAGYHPLDSLAGDFPMPEQQPHFVEITAESIGGLHVRVTHGPSGANLVTDAPKDNGGDASGFSPTDLVATGFLDCMLTTMSIAAKRESIPWGKFRGRVEKHMTPPPRRIGTLVVDLWMPQELPPEQRPRMEQIAHTCPVQRSLHPDVKVELRFHY